VGGLGGALCGQAGHLPAACLALLHQIKRPATVRPRLNAPPPPSSPSPSLPQALEKLKWVYAHWVPEKQILMTNLWSAELAKLTANAMLAQRISSVNAISALCEATGADVSQVSYAIGMDSRIGPKFLQASVGFGGSCFQKDILNLCYVCETVGLKEVSDYWYTVVAMNDYQKQRFVERVIGSMFNTVAGKVRALGGVCGVWVCSSCRRRRRRRRRCCCCCCCCFSAAFQLLFSCFSAAAFQLLPTVCLCDRSLTPHAPNAIHTTAPAPPQRIAIFGFAFKKDTGDTRETPAIDVCRGLLADGAKCAVYDPQVAPIQMFRDLSAPKYAWDRPHGWTKSENHIMESVQAVPDPYATAAGSHAICVLTEWDEFKGYDYQKMYDSMVKPAFVFDGRNILDHAALRKIGFVVYALGKPLDPFLQKTY